MPHVVNLYGEIKVLINVEMTQIRLVVMSHPHIPQKSLLFSSIDQLHAVVYIEFT